MRNIAGELDKAISSVCPITGVSIGKADDKKTWRINFAPEATKRQRADAQAVVDAFDPDSVPEMAIGGDPLATLSDPNSALGALAGLMLSEINKLREKNGEPTYTETQFRNSLRERMG